MTFRDDQHDVALDHIAAALDDPPVGLLRIGAVSGLPPGRVADELGDHTSVLQLDDHNLLVIAPGLSAPAEAEGLALRIKDAIGRASIGVAVSRREDRPGDLLRYVDHAFDDAELLGGDRVVVFDDPDRELLLPPDDV